MNDHPFWRFLFSPWVMGPLMGLLYGVTSRYVLYDGQMGEIFGITTFGFVFLVPMVMGFLTVMMRKEPFKNGWEMAGTAIFLPWLPTFLSLLSALLTGAEVMACLIMAAPVFFFMSSVGGGLALLVRGRGGQNFQRGVLAGFLVLPVSTSALEHAMPFPESLQQVNNTIDIQASPEVVWQQIKTVPLINEQEQGESFFHSLGFPRPLAATLSHEGIGGVRHASFEDNVLFVETVTEWRPQQSLAFTIEAQAEESTSPFLSEKILGGKYFDVLEGRYAIEPLSNGGVRLHLGSQHRVSTHYNLYAGFWTRWVMGDLQTYILKIIKQRSEAQN